MAGKTPETFCTQCGKALPRGSAFCPSCGASARGPADASESAPPAGGPAVNRSVAVAVLAGFLAIGVAAVVYFGRKGDRPRAVSGSPGANAEASQQNVDPRQAGFPPEVKEKVDTTLAELTQKAEAEPKNVDAWRKLARARSRAAQFDDSYTAGAELALDKLMALAPDDQEGVRMYGNLDYVRGDFAGAEGYYRRYLEAQPDDPNVETDLGSVTLFQGKREAAEAIFGHVLAKHPDFMQAHFHLGVALHTAGDREHAIAHLKRAMELADDDDRARIRPYLQAAQNGTPHGQFAAGGTGQGAAAVAAPAPASASAAAPGHVTSNASSEFQHKVDALLLGHGIFGPKIATIHWSGDSTAKVELNKFPMDQMPPVMRNKFKSTMNESIAKIAADHGVVLPVDVELVDGASKRVMDHFDGKELVGAFDEQNDG